MQVVKVLFIIAVCIGALGVPTLVLVGANDEANDPEALRAVFAADAPQAQMMILPHISHFGIFTGPAAAADGRQHRAV